MERRKRSKACCISPNKMRILLCVISAILPVLPVQSTRMREDGGLNIAASQLVAKLLFSVEERKPSCPFMLWGCATNSEGCTPEQLALWTHLSPLIRC